MHTFAIARTLRIVAVLMIVAGDRVHAESASDQCADGVHAWLARCGQLHDIYITPRWCLPGIAVVDASTHPGEPSLRIEIARAGRPEFRQVGLLGLTPVGEFPDWSAADARVRNAFDRVVACAESIGDEEFIAALGDARVPPTPPLRISWRALLAAALWLFAWALARERHAPADLRRALLTAGAWMLATLVVRASALEPAFFHQAGHGPGWLEAARRSGPPHGPGYVEVLGWIVFVTPRHQEAAAFVGNAVIGSFLPVLLLIVARLGGARGWLPPVVALLAMSDPVLTRISLSESYFTAGAALISTAAAIIAWAFGRPYTLTVRALSVVSAGLLAAQAARLHPNTWLPIASIPLVTLTLPRRLPEQASALIMAATGIVLVVAISTGAALLDIVRGPFGHHWVPSSGAAIERIDVAIVFALGAVATAFVFVFPAQRQRFLACAVGCMTLSAFLVMRQLAVAGDRVVYQLATLSLYAAPLVAAGASLASTLRSERTHNGIALSILILGLATLPWRWSALTRLPTDALEARLFIEWREALPQTGHVWFLCYSDGQNLRLPLWAPDDPPAPFAVGHELRLDEQPRPPQSQIEQGLAYYYHSSVCSRPEGRQWCEAAEARLDLEPVRRETLPAVVSGGRPFDSPVLEVVLSRIRGLK